MIVSFEAKYARIVYVVFYLLFPWLKCVSFQQKTFLMKIISGEMFTVTPVFTYMNVSRFEAIFTDGFEIRFGLNKIG